jgi:hypothetical protein
MTRAKKASKKLAYPISPYPGAGKLQVFRWAQYEWSQLGHWQSLAAPVIALVALTTWEREKQLREDREFQITRGETKRFAARTYGAYGERPQRRRLLGLIPLLGGK